MPRGRQYRSPAVLRSDSEIAGHLAASALPNRTFLVALPKQVNLGGELVQSLRMAIVSLSAATGEFPVLPACRNLIEFA
ncbi:MAG: hypothetical protein F4Y60_06055 [Boseongicola sp. SB0664_bin_43]|uniref:Uncharacterized protein n=1 Tax=Boseongicola sp. SB0664_bin_43 TaxID=2604844 RepID=A0A6B0Y0M8_9RHOB|nr:hypothetical protein [Boseongicola sp. SB0664_bin_43]